MSVLDETGDTKDLDIRSAYACVIGLSGLIGDIPLRVSEIFLIHTGGVSDLILLLFDANTRGEIGLRAECGKGEYGRACRFTRL